MDLTSSPAAAAGLQRELKYSLPAAALPSAVAVLRAFCRSDLQYPSATISTIYYDTPEWTSLREKSNSDYLKAKIRVRWYRPAGKPAAGEPAFVEAKLRTGSGRAKLRALAALPAAVLDEIPLDDASLVCLPDVLRGLGVRVPASLAPTLLLTYRRMRFVDRLSALRIALDADLSVARVNPRRVPFARLEPLVGAVLEVKGDASGLPLSLSGVIRLGARRASFCKYYAAYRWVTRSVA